MSKASKILVLSLSAALVLFALAGSHVTASTNDDGAYAQMKVYSEVLSRIRSEYVEDPNIGNVTSGALHGLLESLDPESSYLTAAEYKTYKQTNGSEKKGTIGAAVSKRFGYAAVVAVLPDGPAAKAGVLSGDIIEAIGDKTSRDMSLAQIESLLSGDPGTQVNLVILRIGHQDPVKAAITLAADATPATASKVVEDGIGYIKPMTLTKGKAQEIAAQIKAMEKQGAKKLLLDLRDVAIGDEQEGVETANLFLNHGLITYLEGQKFQRQTFAADPAKAITNLPVAVLVNHGTAGAAEIVAAAIMQNARGDVLGEKTFGEGGVQKVFELQDGSALILSVAKYYTPAGKAIQDEAVTPNVIIATAADTDDEDAAVQQNEQKQQDDNQLKRALEILKARQTAQAQPQK